MGYQGLQGEKKSYRGLQEIRGGKNRLQWAKMG